MTGARACLCAAVLAAAACAAPRVAVRPAQGGGPTVLRVRADAAHAITLSGTMNGWQPQPLERRDGWFEIGLDLPPGRYEYRLEVTDDDGQHAVFPEDAERVPDNFGGENAVLRVR